MCPRTGRPPKNGVTRNKKLTIRLTDEELKRINDCAVSIGRTRADTLMHGVSLIEAKLKSEIKK